MCERRGRTLFYILSDCGVFCTHDDIFSHASVPSPRATFILLRLAQTLPYLLVRLVAFDEHSMQSLVRARQFKDVFTVRQEGDHVQQSIRRKDVVDASNSTRVVFCAGPFARRRLNRRRLCLDIHFDDSFFWGGGALIVEETKSRRVFDFTSRDVPRVDEGKKERKKERTLSSSFSTREIVVLVVVLVVVWCAILFSSSLSKQKDTQGTGTQFFPHFFFCGKPKQREKK